MTHAFCTTASMHRFLIRTVAVSSMALALLVHAQTALQYVPVIQEMAGGATASTICAAATDTIGDGCVATQSMASVPLQPESDAQGNIYFADSNHNVIRRIDVTTNIITVVAGQVSATAIACSRAQNTIGDGCPATQAILSSPHAVHFDRAGNMVIVDMTNQVLRSVDKNTGMISTLMGTGTAVRGVPSNTNPPSPLHTALDNPWNCMFYPNGDMLVVNSTGDATYLAVAVNDVIDPVNSKVYDLAGTGGAGSAGSTNGDGGLATAATFATSRGLAVDAVGNVYIGDYGTERVRKVTSPLVNGQTSPAAILTGTANSIVGNGTATSTGNGGQANLATVTMPQGLTFDNAGNLYIQEYSSGHDFIRIVNPATNIINLYAGTGATGLSGDGGPAVKATITTDQGMKFNLGNRMTIADSSNDRIRNIFPTPFFSAQAVGGTSATENAVTQATVAVVPATATVSTTEFTRGTLSGCTLGMSLAANAFCAIPLTFTPSGPGLRMATLQVKDSAGNVYNDPLLGIGIAPAVGFIGAPIATVAGNGTAGNSGNTGAASSALVNAPRGGVFDGQGNYFFADSENHVIREVTKLGTIAVVAGNGMSGFDGDGASATAAQLNSPAGVTVDAAGNLYIADTGNNRVREVTAATGVITTIAGTGVAGYTGDTGVATAATFNNPQGIAMDNTGTIYVADTGNHALRAFSPLAPGIIVTLAGTGVAGFSGDGGVPQAAKLNAPTAVAADLYGNIYIADTGNGVVRRLTILTHGIQNFNATISTFAGVAGGSGNSGDGGSATAANLSAPSGIGVDAGGNVYIASGGVVRFVGTNGVITTLAGTGAAGAYSGENGNALAAVIPTAIRGLAIDPVGNVFAADTGGNRVLAVTGSSAATVAFGNQTVGTSSTAQTITVFNSGNQPLVLASVAIPAGFTTSTATTNLCIANTTVPGGGNCTITVSFTPTAAGAASGNIVLTDNALNATATTQSIPLTGTGVSPSQPLNPTTTTISTSPAVPTYGQTLTVIATVNGGTGPAGNVDFIINGFRAGTSPVMGGQATIVLANLRAGTDTVTANYLGDTTNAGSTVSKTVAVAQAVLTVTASSGQKYPGQANPALTYTITGFVYSDTAASAVSGAPTETTMADVTSPVGTYPVTVGQGTLAAANYTFVFVAGSITVIPPDFTITVSPTSVSIPAGGIAEVTVTVTPSFGYSGTVALTCGSLPAHVVCTLNSNSLTVAGSGSLTMQLTVSTDDFQHISNVRAGHGELCTLACGLPLLSLGLLFGGRHRRWVLCSALAFAILLGAQGLAGCGIGLNNAAPSSATISVIGTDSVANEVRQAPLGLTIN